MEQSETKCGWDTDCGWELMPCRLWVHSEGILLALGEWVNHRTGKVWALVTVAKDEKGWHFYLCA